MKILENFWGKAGERSLRMKQVLSSRKEERPVLAQIDDADKTMIIQTPTSPVLSMHVLHHGFDSGNRLKIYFFFTCHFKSCRPRFFAYLIQIWWQQDILSFDPSF